LWYNKILNNDPSNGKTHLAISQAYLALGNYNEGWYHYEWRWLIPQAFNKKFKDFMMSNQSLAEKKIFLIGEHGLGDTIQFIRYAQHLKKQGATIIVAAQKPLMQLLSLCPYIDQVIPQGLEPLNSDEQAMLMSLPWILGEKLTNIPATIPYLRADPTLIQLWATKIAYDKNLKIGICWQADVHKDSNNSTVQLDAQKKSIPLAYLATLAKIPKISLYSLQKVNGLEQLNATPDAQHIKIFTDDFDESQGRFMDTAALICNLDLIITIDTSIAHLAGALGKPVLLLLPYNADWRWLTNDVCDTPWYPTMQLFRQSAPNNWTGVINQVEKKVRSLVEN
jgi:hypothetical protein